MPIDGEAPKRGETNAGTGPKKEEAIREKAYFIWLREGRPQGRAQDHWLSATGEGFGEERRQEDVFLDDEEKVLAGRPDANMPALLTKGVQGG
jgi:hypothetical protein